MSRETTHDAPAPSGTASPGVECGEMLVLSAPSAVGKTTLIRRVFERYPRLAQRLAFSVSHTTRPPRPGEVEGESYHFVERTEFERMIAAGDFLEWAVVHGRLYGTSHAAVRELCNAGFDVVLDVDVQGARQISERHPEVPSIFILPPSYEEMERRLRSRGQDSEEQILRRLSNAREEMRCYSNYEYVILNDELERACEALAAIFLARRCRRDRMRSEIDRVLGGFPPPDR